MSIGLVIGVPGTGKTYKLVELMLAALRAGRVVVHNVAGFPKKDVPLLAAAVAEKRLLTFGALHPCDFPIADLADDGRMLFRRPKMITPNSFYQRYGFAWPRGSLIILDEYYVSAKGTMKALDEREAFYAFLRAHRHYTSEKFGCDIIVAAQHDSDLPQQLREIVEWTIHCRRDRFWKGKLDRLLFTEFVSAKSAKASAAADVVNFRPRASIYGLYDSYAGASPEDADSAKAVSYFGRIRSYLMMLGVVFGILVWIWGRLLLDWFGAFHDPFSSFAAETPAGISAAAPPRSGPCLFIHGSDRGFVLRGDCRYQDGSSLRRDVLDDALRVEISPAPQPEPAPPSRRGPHP